MSSSVIGKLFNQHFQALDQYATMLANNLASLKTSQQTTAQKHIELIAGLGHKLHEISHLTHHIKYFSSESHNMCHYLNALSDELIACEDTADKLETSLTANIVKLASLNHARRTNKRGLLQALSAIQGIITDIMASYDRNISLLQAVNDHDQSLLEQIDQDYQLFRHSELIPIDHTLDLECLSGQCAGYVRSYAALFINNSQAVTSQSYQGAQKLTKELLFNRLYPVDPTVRTNQTHQHQAQVYLDDKLSQSCIYARFINQGNLLGETNPIDELVDHAIQNEGQWLQLGLLNQHDEGHALGLGYKQGQYYFMDANSGLFQFEATSTECKRRLTAYFQRWNYLYPQSKFDRYHMMAYSRPNDSQAAISRFKRYQLISDQMLNKPYSGTLLRMKKQVHDIEHRVSRFKCQFWKRLSPLRPHDHHRPNL